MTRSFILAILIVLGLQATHAQDNKVTEGVEAFQYQDFSRAMSLLDEALQTPERLSGTNHVKALYYRGLVRVYIYNNAVLKNDESTLALYPNAYLDASYDLAEARRIDDGTWRERINEQLTDMHPGLVQFAMQYAAESGVEAENLQNFAQLARSYAEAAVAILDNYMARDALGQALDRLGDNALAKENFRRSIDQYNSNPPARPDFYQPYVYYRLARTWLRENADPEKALEITLQGQQFVSREWERYEALAGSAFPHEKNTIHQLASQAQNDLETFELQLYMSYPVLHSRGIQKFEKAINRDPKNVELYLAYAKMLEVSDFDRAAELYKTATAIAPDSFIAWFNAGVMYYNRATQLYDQLENEKDDKKFQLVNDRMREYFEQAIPYFEESLKRDRSLDAISALTRICFILDREECYKKYSEMGGTLY